MRRRKPIRQINLRITEQLRQRLESAAQERRISTNELMRQLLEDGLEKENKDKQSLEDRVRRLEEAVQRSDTPLPARVAAAEEARKKEGGKT
jgi:ribosome recycling factor